jgi:heptosyltransferase-2
VLIVKLVALGDIVMASTMVGALRRRWPDAHITWATGKGFAPLVRRFRGVDSVVEVDESALLRGGVIARGVAALRAVFAIGSGYDLAIVAHTDVRYERLVRFARATEVRALRNGALPRGPRPGHWFGAEYARLIADDAGEEGEEFGGAPPLAELEWPGGAPSRGGSVTLAPGGARNLLRDDHLRRWPVEHWVALATQLVAAGHRVTLIGGAQDHAEGDAVRRVTGVRDLTGKLSLVETLELIACSNVLVSHDSGPLHLAALTGTPSIGLFGPTDPRAFVSSRADIAIASAAAGLPCAPCYDGHGYAVCDDNRCLRGVPAERVAELVLTRLGAAQKTR